MLLTLFAILLVMWLLGFFAFHVAGGLIHLLLIIAVMARRPHPEQGFRTCLGVLRLFRGIDAILRPAVKLFPKSLRQRAIDRAVSFVTEHLNGEDGLGAIFPAMANATMMFDVLGDSANAAIARNSIEKLLIVGSNMGLTDRLCRMTGGTPSAPRLIRNGMRMTGLAFEGRVEHQKAGLPCAILQVSQR